VAETYEKADKKDPANKEKFSPGDPGEDVVKMGGSMFIGNTSYSGVDIKVVITSYDSTTKDDVNKIQEAIQQSRADLAQYAKKSGEATLKELQTKIGTQERERFKNEFGVYNKKWLAEQETAESLEEILRSAEKQVGLVQASTKVLAECQTISISTHRDKVGVRSCGSVYPKGFTRGPREIAGSLVFTVFHEHVLHQFLQASISDFDANVFTSALMDQLPPVDILIAFANEYGSISRMGIYGVEFVDEG